MTPNQLLRKIVAAPMRYIDIAGGNTQKRRQEARAIVEPLVAAGLIRRAYIGGIAYYVASDWRPGWSETQLAIDARSRRTVDGCTNWLARIDPVRGPMVTVNVDAHKTQPKSVRRVLWERHRGKLPLLSVLKPTCENPACIELDHMEIRRHGTIQAGRKRPMDSRIRMAEAQRKLKTLTIEDAREIRASEKTNRELAEIYGVSAANIGYIRRGVTLREYTGLFSGLLAANDSTKRRA